MATNSTNGTDALKPEYFQQIIKKDPLLENSDEFFSKIKGRSYEELSEEEVAHLSKLVHSARSYTEALYSVAAHQAEVMPPPDISPMDVYDHLSKGIEAVLVALDTNLHATNDIIPAFQNANTARDIGVNYADLMGYPTTWDNPADAYRHFAWNWLNTEDIGEFKARLIGDYHELALEAANYVLDNYPFLNLDDMIVIGTVEAYNIDDYTKSSLSNFNSQFDNATIMDIINNYHGRKYSTNRSFTRVADAFYEAFFTDEVLVGWTSEITSSKRSTAYNYWK